MTRDLVDGLLYVLVCSSIILLIAGVVLAIIFPINQAIWKAIDPSLSLPEYNPGFEEEIIRPGDIVEFGFASYTSIDGFWSASRVEFVPTIQSLGIWEGQDSKCEIPFDKDAGTRSAHPQVKFQIPDDPSLEGRIIDGTLKMNLSYPEYAGSFYYRWVNKDIEKPISIKIFSAEEAETFTALTEDTTARLDSVCFQTWVFCLGGGAILFGCLLIGGNIADRRKKRIQNIKQ